MPFTTHAATEEDVAFLVDVFLRAMRGHISTTRGSWDELKERTQFLDQLQVQHTTIIRRDGVNVGFLATRDRGQDVELHTLCVAPEHQGRGLGTAVTRQLLDDCRARGQGVVLSVLKVNTRGRALYERLGLAVTGQTLNHYQMRLVR
jgi:ribosomal protein S18 acetylase RimI-like enzyme